MTSLPPVLGPLFLILRLASIILLCPVTLIRFRFSPLRVVIDIMLSSYFRYYSYSSFQRY